MFAVLGLLVGCGLFDFDEDDAAAPDTVPSDEPDTVLATAGNETTNRLIGWTGKLLADHPDERRKLVRDRSLVPNAIEEILRYEPPAPHIARFPDWEVDRGAAPAVLHLYGARLGDAARRQSLTPEGSGDGSRGPVCLAIRIHGGMRAAGT